MIDHELGYLSSLPSLFQTSSILKLERSMIALHLPQPWVVKKLHNALSPVCVAAVAG
jgi:hypothetical protein